MTVSYGSNGVERDAGAGPGKHRRFIDKCSMNPRGLIDKFPAPTRRRPQNLTEMVSSALTITTLSIRHRTSAEAGNMDWLLYISGASVLLACLTMMATGFMRRGA